MLRSLFKTQVCAKALSHPWSRWVNCPSITQTRASRNTLSIISLWSRYPYILMNYHNFWFSNVPNYTVPHMPLEPGAPCRMQCSMGSEHWKVTANVWKTSVFAVTQIWVWVLPLQLVSSAESLFSHLWEGNGIYPRGDTKAVWNNIEIMPLGVWYLEGPQPVSFLDWSGFCAVHACLLSVYYMPDAEWDSGKQQQIRWPLLSGDLQHSRVCSKTAAKRLRPDQVSPVGSLIVEKPGTV